MLLRAIPALGAERGPDLLERPGLGGLAALGGLPHRIRHLQHERAVSRELVRCLRLQDLLRVLKRGIVSPAISSGEERQPKPVPFVSPRSRTRVLSEFWRAPARCFAIADDSLNVSKKPRSAMVIQKPAPVTPFCRVSHSSSVKSDLVAMA